MRVNSSFQLEKLNLKDTTGGLYLLNIRRSVTFDKAVKRLYASKYNCRTAPPPHLMALGGTELCPLFCTILRHIQWHILGGVSQFLQYSNRDRVRRLALDLSNGLRRGVVRVGKRSQRGGSYRAHVGLYRLYRCSEVKTALLQDGRNGPQKVEGNRR